LVLLLFVSGTIAADEMKNGTTTTKGEKLFSVDLIDQYVEAIEALRKVNDIQPNRTDPRIDASECVAFTDTLTKMENCFHTMFYTTGTDAVFGELIKVCDACRDVAAQYDVATKKEERQVTKWFDCYESKMVKGIHENALQVTHGMCEKNFTTVPDPFTSECELQVLSTDVSDVLSSHESCEKEQQDTACTSNSSCAGFARLFYAKSMQIKPCLETSYFQEKLNSKAQELQQKCKFDLSPTTTTTSGSASASMGWTGSMSLLVVAILPSLFGFFVFAV